MHQFGVWLETNAIIFSLIAQVQAEADDLKRKHAALVKTHASMTQNYEDAVLELERVQGDIANTEKKQRKFDQQVRLDKRICERIPRITTFN